MDQTARFTCPTLAELEDFIAGRLAIDRHRKLEGHIRGCPQCQAELSAIADQDDHFLRTVRELLGSPDPDPPPPPPPPPPPASSP